MKLHQLRDFIAIADHGSLRGAARHLGSSAPALIKSMGQLEEEMHVPLLQRGSRGVTLTDCGQALLRRARLIDTQSRMAKEEIAQLRGSLEGALSLGASPTPGVALMPAALAGFRQTYPEVRVSMVGGLYQGHIEAIRSGRMDFAVTAVGDGGLDRDLLGEDLLHNELVVAARHGHPRAGARSLRELADCAWIVTGPARSGPGASVLQAFEREGLAPPRQITQCDLDWALLSLLQTSDMLCALPRLFLPYLGLQDRLQTIAVAEPLPCFRIALVQRADTPLLPMAAHFATLVRRQAEYLCQAHPHLRVAPALAEA